MNKSCQLKEIKKVQRFRCCMIQNSVFYKDRIYQSQQLTVKISKESRNNCSFLEIEQKTFSSVFFLIKVNWT